MCNTVMFMKHCYTFICYILMSFIDRIRLYLFSGLETRNNMPNFGATRVESFGISSIKNIVTTIWKITAV